MSFPVCRQVLYWKSTVRTVLLKSKIVSELQIIKLERGWGGMGWDGGGGGVGSGRD